MSWIGHDSSARFRNECRLHGCGVNRSWAFAKTDTPASCGYLWLRLSRVIRCRLYDVHCATAIRRAVGNGVGRVSQRRRALTLMFNFILVRWLPKHDHAHDHAPSHSHSHSHSVPPSQFAASEGPEKPPQEQPKSNRAKNSRSTVPLYSQPDRCGRNAGVWEEE